jgi:lysine 6-dehydrogenase
MDILVLGYGNIGSIITSDLAIHMPSDNIAVCGRRIDKVEEVVENINKNNVIGIQVDANKYKDLVKTMKRFNVVVGALPGEIGYKSTRAAIDAHVDFVDVSYMPENPLTLGKEAAEAGITVVPDCGVAPGVSNLLVGHAVSELDKAKNIKIMVGGLPEKPIPPLGYTITWSTEGLLDEYARKAKIVKDGNLIEVEALTGLEDVEFPGIGMLEAFYTDGLRTLIDTMKNIDTMCEKTLRYKGHVSKIQLLKALGFLDEIPVEIGNAHFAPRELTAKLLEERLKKPEIPDLLAMKVEVIGIKNGDEISFIYHLLDRNRENTTAMARTTGYPTSILTQLVAQGFIQEKGVLPLEILGADEDIYNKILGELKKRQITIREDTK